MPMRLIARKVYRAFPELDRFSDHQCERFVRAVNRKYRSFVLRWFLVGTLSALALAASLALVEWLLYERDNGWRTYQRVPWFIADLLSLALPLMLAGGVALVTRDIVIRLQIRRVIKTRGTCLTCGYSLLGIRVAEDRTVTCPECGTLAEADDALGELHTTDSGVQVFNPVMHSETMRLRALAKARRRRRLKVGAFIVLAAMLAIATTFGLWWWRIDRQAAAAQAARVYPAQVAAWQTRFRPKDLPPEANNSWGEFSRALRKFNDVNGTHLSAKLTRPPAFTRFYGECNPEFLIKEENQAGDPDAINLTYSLHLEKNTLANFLVLADRPWIERDAAPAPGGWGTLWTMDLVDLHRMATLALARLHQAARHEGGVGCADAVRVLRLCVRVFDCDPWLYARSLSNAVRTDLAMVLAADAKCIPSAQMLDEIAAALPPTSSPIPLDEHIELEYQGVLDSLRWFYSNPEMVRKAHVIGTQRAMNYALMPGNQKFIVPEWLPSLDAATLQAKQVFTPVFEIAKPSGTSTTPPASTQPPSELMNVFVEMRAGWCRNVVQNQSVPIRAVRKARIALAIEAYQRRHGVYPPTLEVLVGQGLSAEDLSPADKPWKYTPWDPNSIGPPAINLDPPD